MKRSFTTWATAMRSPRANVTESRKPTTHSSDRGRTRTSHPGVRHDASRGRRHTAPLGLSQPTVSHHLKVLKDAGLVTRVQRGTPA